LDAAALAQDLDDTEPLVEAALGATQGNGRIAEADDERNAVLEAALAALGDTDGALRARLLVVLAEAIDAQEWMRRRDLAIERFPSPGLLGTTPPSWTW
jgi:hypothetical protein